MARQAVGDKRYAAQNRKARHEYFIEDRLEAGIMLVGTEVKSLRQGRANINDAYASDVDGELYLLNAHIGEFHGGNRFNHEPRRPRKLLVHRRERDKLLAAVHRQGMTIVPLAIYFNARGFAKVEIGIAKGKRKYDKRASEKERDWNRQKQRLIRGRE